MRTEPYSQGVYQPERRTLTEFERPLRQAVPVALDREIRPIVGLRGGTEGDEQWGEMLDRGVGVRHPRSLLPEREQLVDVATFERFGRPLVEVDRPLGSSGLAEEILVNVRQPMRHEAAADDQDAFIAKGREPAADREEVLGIEVGHRHLEDR